MAIKAYRDIEPGEEISISCMSLPLVLLFLSPLPNMTRYPPRPPVLETRPPPPTLGLQMHVLSLLPASA